MDLRFALFAFEAIVFVTQALDVLGLAAHRASEILDLIHEEDRTTGGALHPEW